MRRLSLFLLIALALVACERSHAPDAAQAGDLREWMDEQRKMMRGKVPLLPEPPPAPTDVRPASRPDPFSADGFVRGCTS